MSRILEQKRADLSEYKENLLEGSSQMPLYESAIAELEAAIQELESKMLAAHQNIIEKLEPHLPFFEGVNQSLTNEDSKTRTTEFVLSGGQKVKVHLRQLQNCFMSLNNLIKLNTKR